MWHDNETSVDYLNFDLVATACADLIRDAGGEPISIGVSGGWGTGKSSLVRMIETQLRATEGSNKHFVVVTFNPWLYQGFEDARSALLQIVGDAVLTQASSNPTMAAKAKALLHRVNVLRLIQLGGEVAATLITGVPIGLVGTAMDKALSAFRKNSVEEAADAAKGAPEAAKGLLKPAEPVSLPQEIHGFRSSLEQLLEELGITLVIFVDDLDRCLPKTAISTLEAIRLLLFIKGSAFVVAADDAFIRGSVKVHFAGTGMEDDVATNYFDKLIQVPLRVPRLGPNETKAYTALLFLEHAFKKRQVTAEAFEAARKRVAERLRESWKGEGVDLVFLESLVADGNPELLGLMGLAERLAPLLSQASSVQSNPRLIKRFLNTVFLRKALASPQGIDLSVNVLAKWHLLERCNEVVANAVADGVSANSGGRVTALHDAEVAATQADAKLPAMFGEQPFVQEWLLLPPQLGEMDLRPLLHLSRDTVIRDFGADELNQAGKALRDALLTARAESEILKTQILAAGDAQATLALSRAWEMRSTTRTWQKSEDVFPLIQVCKVFASAGTRASTLLSAAPKGHLAPGLIPPLLNATWAAPILAEWLKADETPPAVKRAIEQGAT